MKRQWPLDQVIATNSQDFVPERPDLPPWAQPRLRSVEYAATGNVVTVPLRIADRVQLRGLDRATRDPWDMLPEDMTRQSWGLPPA